MKYFILRTNSSLVISFLLLLAFCYTENLNAQVVIVNHEFTSATTTPCSDTSTIVGVTSVLTTSTGSCTRPSGLAVASPPAFVTNSDSPTASASISGVNTAPQYFQFALGGTQLSNYSSYMVFFQSNRSSSGPPDGDLQYSTDGINFTSAGTFTNPTSFSATGFTFDLSAVTELNAQSMVFFRLVMANATSSVGTIRLDNFQVQATPTTAAPGTISGRASTTSGVGIKHAVIMLTGGDLAEPIYATTNQFGIYQFQDITVGETYVLQIMSGRYTFANPSLVVELGESITDADFIVNDGTTGVPNRGKSEIDHLFKQTETKKAQ